MAAVHAENRFDVLRLVAAWLVLLNHCYPLSGAGGTDIVTQWVKLDTAGGIGVAVFFSISGYLVTISAERSPTIRQFAWRRMLRIYPALITVTVLSALVIGPLVTRLSLPEYFGSGRTWQYLKSAVAFKVEHHLPGVFEANPVPAVNGSLWSLPYEMRCYVVLAVLALVPIGWKLKAAAVAALLACLLILRPLVPPAGAFESFRGLDYYATKLGLMFFIGALLAAWRGHLARRAWHVAGVFALATLVSAWWLPFGVVQLVLYTVSMPVFTLWLALYATWLPRIPDRMGDLSYGVYLYAFPAQQVLTQLHAPALGMAAYLLLSTMASVGAAWCSWHWVEKPAIRLKSRAGAATREAGEPNRLEASSTSASS